jgi:hypothetical protein
MAKPPKVTFETPCRCGHTLYDHDQLTIGWCLAKNCECHSFRRADLPARRLFGLLPGR